MNEEKYTELEKKVFEAYMQKTPKSKQMYDRASRSLAGGVCGNGRFAQPYPLYTTHGKGSSIYDVDGNEYIDFHISFGALLLGHCHPEVMEKVKYEFDKGLIVFNIDLAVECAELLKEIVPCAEKVRFANSGTEANMIAARTARAFTGKSKIIKFYGHYHGQEDQFLIGQGNTDAALSAGVPIETIVNTVLLPWNNIDAVKHKLEEDDDIAAVILDPLGAAGGFFAADAKYLKELRELTKERKVVLIFDEVLSGFRIALGGAQEYYGVTPDLACFAKAIASGARMAALVGKDEFMSVLTPTEGTGAFYGVNFKVFQSGTTIEETTGVAAAVATMKLYKRLREKGEYEKLAQRGSRLNSAWADAWRQRDVPCHLTGIGSEFKLHLTDLKPDFSSYSKLDKRLISLFARSLLAEGVRASTRPGGGFMASFAHTDEDIDRTIDAINTTLDKYNWPEVYHS